MDKQKEVEVEIGAKGVDVNDFGNEEVPQEVPTLAHKASSYQQ